MNLRAWAKCISFASLTLTACGQQASSGGREGDDIVGGTSAANYPEAVLVDLMKGGERYAACSGTLIAPAVVLTAGHCVHGTSSWQVTAPGAGGQTEKGTRGITYDWNASGEAVDPNQHDVGLIFLAGPIHLDSYPSLASAPLASGKSVLNIGRIHDGELSDSELYVSKSVRISDATSIGFPFDYKAVDKIEPGDSGGPDVLAGGSPHTIVAVNSGAGQGDEVLARVDLVRDWIEGRIAAAGGSSGGGSGGGGGASSCAHDVCATGKKLAKSCDPCVTQVCAADSYCCAHGWDADCVSEAATVCGASCGGACGSVGAEGACKGDELAYCDGGTLAKADCSAYGLSCEFDSDSGEYDCL